MVKSSNRKLIELVADVYQIDPDILAVKFKHGFGIDADALLERAKLIEAMTKHDKFDASLMRYRSQLAAWTVDGKIWVYEWGRDCDLCEADSVYQIDATLEAFFEREESIYNNAEGPTAFYMISPADAKKFEPSFRDRAAELMNY